MEFSVTCSQDKYELIYHANDGTWTDGEKIKVESDLPAGPHTLSTELPENGELVFIGWTTDSNVKKSYGEGAQLPTLVENNTVEIPTVTDLYAVWGLDETGDGIADALQIIIRPADIIIYTGGEGYSSIVDENGNKVTPEDEMVSGDNGLPEPGYYFTLPYELNVKLREALDSGTDDPTDLAQHLQIVKPADGAGDHERQWTLQRYNNSTAVDEINRYIYQMLPGASGDQVRLMIRDEGNNFGLTSDEFDIKINNLFETYFMKLYPGKVDPKTITATVCGVTSTDPVLTKSYSIGLAEGELTVRGTTKDVVSEPVLDAGSTVSNVQKVTAVAPKNVTYYVNGSDFPLNTKDEVHLLSDELADDAATTALKNNAEQKFAELKGMNFDFKYLDLVDDSNGNIYVTIDDDKQMTIYWPISELTVPAGQEIDYSKIYVVHYEGLDRDFTNLEQTLQTYEEAERSEVTVDQENGVLKFQTGTFSPFAIVYSTKDAVTNVTVTFDGGKYGTIPESGATVSVEQGKSLQSGQIPSVTIKDRNATFTGWKSSIDGKIYTNDDLLTLAIDKNTTFTAQYDYDDHDQGGIQYDHHLYYHSNFGKDQQANEGTDDNTVVVQDYEDLKILPDRDGYTFVNWNTEKDGSGDTYWPGDDFDLTDTEHHLYAQWQKDKTGPDDSGVSNWLETKEHRAYLSGYPDSTFRADRNMTRAEVAQMFYALLLDKDVTITKSFSDVPDDAWYATAVKTLASLGMMDGYPDGTFRPDEPITRAEFATVGLAFAYDPMDASCSYYDVSANAWYYTYVAQASTYGWIGGYPDNTFRPGNNITRVEVCVIVNNMLGRCADERYIDRHQDELVHFVDLSDSYWGYYTIMESTNTHDYTGSYYNETWKS